MLATIYALIQSIPMLEKLIMSFVSGYQTYLAEKEAASIAQAAKDAEQAKTDEDLKKAAEEAAAASRKL